MKSTEVPFTTVETCIDLALEPAQADSPEQRILYHTAFTSGTGPLRHILNMLPGEGAHWENPGEPLPRQVAALIVPTEKPKKFGIYGNPNLPIIEVPIDDEGSNLSLPYTEIYIDTAEDPLKIESFSAVKRYKQVGRRAMLIDPPEWHRLTFTSKDPFITHDWSGDRDAHLIAESEVLKKLGRLADAVAMGQVIDVKHKK